MLAASFFKFCIKLKHEFEFEFDFDLRNEIARKSEKKNGIDAQKKREN